MLYQKDCEQVGSVIRCDGIVLSTDDVVERLVLLDSYHGMLEDLSMSILGNKSKDCELMMEKITMLITKAENIEVSSQFRSLVDAIEHLSDLKDDILDDAYYEAYTPNNR